jgi:hypothetical protein
VEPRGFEPLTSAVQRRHNTLLEVSGACKIAANGRILPITHFPALQEIYSGCYTVAAHTPETRLEFLFCINLHMHVPLVIDLR